MFDNFKIYSSLFLDKKTIGSNVAQVNVHTSVKDNTYKQQDSIAKKLFATVLGLSVFGLILFVVVISLYHTAIISVSRLWFTLFSVFLPAGTIVLAIRVAYHPHPVHSLLSLIGAFFGMVIVYLNAEAEFLAFVFLIVYVGAIAILFLFVIMLLNVKELAAVSKQEFNSLQWIAMAISYNCSLYLSSDIFFMLDSFFIKSSVMEFSTESANISTLVSFINFRFFDIQIFSELLYTYYSALFMLTALLLLTAMLGAIVLATSATDVEKE